MPSKFTLHWWGFQACYDENETKELLAAIDTGGDVGGAIAQLAPEAESKAILALVAAVGKLQSRVIKAVDEKGGSNGVCISTLWGGPPTCWVKPRPA